MFRFLFKYFSKEAITKRKKAKAAKILGVHLSLLDDFKELSDSMPKELIKLAKFAKAPTYKAVSEKLFAMVDNSYRHDQPLAAKALSNVYASLAFNFKDTLSYHNCYNALTLYSSFTRISDNIYNACNEGVSFATAFQDGLDTLDALNLSEISRSMIRRGIYVRFKEELAEELAKPEEVKPEECAQEIEVIKPKRGKLHNNEQRREAVAKVAAGTSPTIVAEEYGISYNTMRNWVNKFNPKFAKQKYHLKNRVAVIVLNESQVKDILASNLSREELAVKYKVSGSTITRVLNGTYKAKKG